LTNWRHEGIADDIRPLLLGELSSLKRFAIATLVAVDGPSPRDIGAQMLITADNHWGFLSGGCVEDDVARHGREVIGTDEHRLLRYGEGSPWFDIKLACGAGISVLVEPTHTDDPAITTLISGYRAREPVAWQSDGVSRDAHMVGPTDAISPRWDGSIYSTVFEPALRLVIIGNDATALAVTELAIQIGIETVLVAPGGPEAVPFPGMEYRRSTDAIPLDQWTAVAVVTHDRDDDERALAAALSSDAFYVGAIGARSRLHSRIERLQICGVSAADIARLHAPIGLHGFGKSPRDIALSIVAEVKRDFQSRSATARSAGVSTSSVAPTSVIGR
jgi:xanthine dehydrogenase accessory factor